ncbi:type VII secretion target [Micromonospora sp. WMMC415]|uniref:type VII secretion target n=1 Tax=Micromonospora sp. WMMC415 TaxID=2675222 RepID=UPI0018AFFB59|nr:type VII secretion target [Micromonospora sp. WMMC415]
MGKLLEVAVAGDQRFEVDSLELHTHAGAVDGVADVVDQCRRAAASVHLGRDAYGRLCQLIPSLLHPVQEAAVDALNEATGALQGTADDLRSVAGRYDSDDRGVARLFHRGAGA